LKRGHLSQHFEAVVAKRLSAVEADPNRSNQHEFNGVRALKMLFGNAKGTFPAKFLYLGEDEETSMVADGTLTWYDAREQHATRTEHRLYFPTTAVSERAAQGDLLLIGRRAAGELLVLIAKAGGTVESQLLWLFNLDLDERGAFVARTVTNGSDRPIGFAADFILEQLGIQPAPERTLADLVVEKFPDGFPPTRIFSAFARETAQDVSANDDPDGAVIAWMEREEKLFRGLEHHLVKRRIGEGFGTDVDEFISFSLSLHNRRKSRAGFALENHLEQVFQDRGLRFARGAKTEGRSTPDFLFPGQKEYRDESFPSNRLYILGAKSTCKERWRQVLAEANRVKRKHLLTLEPAISLSQTTEMEQKSLQLVVPKSLHDTYSAAQQSWLMDLARFIRLVESRQDK
jgi:hypothetical protein